MNDNEHVFLCRWAELEHRVYQLAVDKGWYEKDPSIGELLCGIHTEVSEAVQAVREERLSVSKNIPDFLSVEEELADVVLRVMSLAGRYKWRISEAIVAKNDFNRSRPKRHGKRF